MFLKAQHDNQTTNDISTVMCCNAANQLSDQNVFEESANTNTPNEEELDNMQIRVDDIVAIENEQVVIF